MRDQQERMMKYVTLLIITSFCAARCPAQPVSAKAGDGIIETIIDPKAYPCFDVYGGKLPQTEYVIDSDSAYSLYKQLVDKSCDFPDIDFDKHTLLGMFGGGNNYCDVEYFRHVENDKAHARYIFTLTVNQKGFCKMAVRWHWHWVLVPKVPRSYTVQFKVNRIRGDRKTSKDEQPKPASPVYPLSPCKSITGYLFTQGKSGIEGKIVKGPMSPVNRKGDTGDSYIPLQGTIVVKRSTDKKEVTRIRADVNGEFRLAIRPGKYIIEPLPVGKKEWPRPAPPCVIDVKADRYAQIRIGYDTGIR